MCVCVCSFVLSSYSHNLYCIRVYVWVNSLCTSNLHTQNQHRLRCWTTRPHRCVCVYWIPNLCVSMQNDSRKKEIEYQYNIFLHPTTHLVAYCVGLSVVCVGVGVCVCMWSELIITISVFLCFCCVFSLSRLWFKLNHLVTFELVVVQHAICTYGAPIETQPTE